MVIFSKSFIFKFFKISKYILQLNTDTWLVLSKGLFQSTQDHRLSYILFPKQTTTHNSTNKIRNTFFAPTIPSKTEFENLEGWKFLQKFVYYQLKRENCWFWVSNNIRICSYFCFFRCLIGIRYFVGDLGFLLNYLWYFLPLLMQSVKFANSMFFLCMGWDFVLVCVFVWIVGYYWSLLLIDRGLNWIEFRV